jgi:hypothetical protein
MNCVGPGTASQIKNSAASREQPVKVPPNLLALQPADQRVREIFVVSGGDVVERLACGASGDLKGSGRRQ